MQAIVPSYDTDAPHPASDTSNVEDRGGVQVIARCAAILRALGENPAGLSLGGIAKAVGLPRSTVQRIVNALEAEQFVESAGPGGGTRLGPALLKLVSRLEADIVTVARADLEALSRQTGETVLLTQTLGHQSRVLYDAISEQEVRIVPQPAALLNLHALSHGKVALARMNDAAVRACLGPDPLRRLTPRTITDHATLSRELDGVRATGLAFDREEHGEGVCAIGTGISYAGRDYEIVVLMPAYRFDASEEAIRTALLACARTIETTSRRGSA
jgi:IclR family acetate operon transcriptional repressor